MKRELISRYTPQRAAHTTLLLLLALRAGAAQTAEKAQPERYLADVKYLASPELEGRGAGTKGIERASHYIEKRFKELHLQAAGEQGSFLQALQVTTGAKPGSHNHLSVSGGKALHLGLDYTPVSFSGDGEVQGQLVFAGYGITAPEMHYDDYAGLDVKDKTVLVLRYEPKSFQKEGKEGSHTRHASLVSKAINARNHGATAVILVNGQMSAGKGDELIRFGSVSGPDNSGVLMVQVKSSIAAHWLETTGRNLATLQAEIDSKSAPASFVLPEALRIKLQVDIKREQATVRNVVGYLPGKDKEFIILGAHYDHLGLGNESSLAPSQIGRIHPGADDNASGTAGLLELARLLSHARGSLQRGVLFIAFAGEEIGLLGSSYWTNHPTMPLQNAVAMLNMDMIGRVSGSRLYIGGTGTGSTFDSILKSATGRYTFKIDYSTDGFSSSDHTSFAAKSIPVLFFFSGLHGDYHKPSDTWDKIDAPDAAEIVNLVDDVAMQLIQAETRPKFAKVEAGPHGGSSVSAGSGYGPYFGSIPDFAPIDKGVKFSDVRAGSPAAKAGLQAGDVLIGFGDKPVNNLYDFTYALQNSKVGDVVTVKFLRDGMERSAQVTLEARR